MNEYEQCLLCSGRGVVHIKRNGNRIFIYTESQLDETIEDTSQEFDIPIADKEDNEKLHMTLFEEKVRIYIKQHQKLTQKREQEIKLNEKDFDRRILINVSVKLSKYIFRGFNNTIFYIMFYMLTFTFIS